MNIRLLPAGTPGAPPCLLAAPCLELTTGVYSSPSGTTRQPKPKKKTTRPWKPMPQGPGGEKKCGADASTMYERQVMEITKVVELWQLFQHAGLHVCIDGGWAVDAVLGEQTRPHSDLDIALPASEVPALRALLAERHFAVVPSADSWAHNFVLGDAQGRLIDLHSYELHPDGSNRLGVPYIADHLRGSGSILGTRVRCVPPEWLVAFHTGYEVDDDDWHDVRLLCERFGLEVPPAFSRFRMHRD